MLIRLSSIVEKNQNQLTSNQFLFVLCFTTLCTMCRHQFLLKFNCCFNKKLNGQNSVTSSRSCCVLCVCRRFGFEATSPETFLICCLNNWNRSGSWCSTTRRTSREPCSGWNKASWVFFKNHSLCSCVSAMTPRTLFQWHTENTLEQCDIIWLSAGGFSLHVHGYEWHDPCHSYPYSVMAALY